MFDRISSRREKIEVEFWIPGSINLNEYLPAEMHSLLNANKYISIVVLIMTEP
jgi:hypothetical protein